MIKFHLRHWDSHTQAKKTYFYVVVSTQLKNITQNENLPQIGMKIKK